MKILYVLDTYYPKIDGPATVINQLSEIINQNEFAIIDILVPYFPNYTDKFNYRVIRCKSLPGTDGYRTPTPIFNLKLKSLLKKENYDIIHIHSPFTLGNFALKFAKKHNIPSICTVHTNYLSDFKRKLKCKILVNFMMKYISKIINKADYLLTVSNQFSKDLKNQYGCHKKANVIRNATEFIDNTDLSDKITLLNQKHKITSEFKLLFVGRLVKNKNIQFSLKVLRELKNSNITNFKFFIVGDGDFKKDLISITKEYGLENNVVFTGLIENRDELKSYYKFCDLFLFPSKIDTCGIVALEAGSLGLPSLMIKNTCASELIKNNYNGFVETENIQLWEKSIIKIMDFKNYNDIRENAKKSLGITWKQISDKCINFYKFVLLLSKLKNKQTCVFIKHKKFKRALIKTSSLYKGV